MPPRVLAVWAKTLRKWLIKNVFQITNTDLELIMKKVRRGVVLKHIPPQLKINYHRLLLFFRLSIRRLYLISTQSSPSSEAKERSSKDQVGKRLLVSLARIRKSQSVEFWRENHDWHLIYHFRVLRARSSRKEAMAADETEPTGQRSIINIL